MDFRTVLAQKTEEVNRGLAAYIPKASEENDVIKEAMAYSIAAGGKRLRPMILLEVCRLFTTDERVLQSASCFAAALRGRTLNVV